MAFDFPASPSEGQVFSPPAGPTYVFNTPAWRAVGQGQIATIGDTFPANPANGQIHWESDTGRLFISYNDGNSTQWVQISGIPAPTAASPFLRTRFTSNTTAFQYDATTTYADVELVGGGGGGGGTTGASSAGAGNAAGGGGGGSYSKLLIPITATVRLATKTITVGAGGAAGSGGAGGTGGQTGYDDGVNSMIAPGGVGGAAGSPINAMLVRLGGAGGIVSNAGALNINGMAGAPGIAFGNILGAGLANATGGNGGSGAGFAGGGGQGGALGTGSAATNGPGNAGFGFGGGGSGACTINAVGGQSNGGIGAPGIVIITEYR
jgi:hypothetical protein